MIGTSANTERTSTVEAEHNNWLTNKWNT